MSIPLEGQILFFLIVYLIWIIIAVDVIIHPDDKE